MARDAGGGLAVAEREAGPRHLTKEAPILSKPIHRGNDPRVHVSGHDGPDE